MKSELNLSKEGFTPGETTIAINLVTGASNKEIASHLKLSQNTVKTHLRRIFSKLKVRTRTAAAIKINLLMQNHPNG